jgi:pimeloyl-ACP methyl ester carboxylesterase
MMSRRALVAWLLGSLLVLGACASSFQEGPHDPGPRAKKLIKVNIGGPGGHQQPPGVNVPIGDSNDTFQLNYDVVGEGAPVLYLHGYGSFMNMWYGTALALADGHRSILVDLPGHGLSDRRRMDYSPQGVARLLARFLEALGERRVTVVAHSWGASVALALALQAPERVERLVLVDGWVYQEQNNTFMDWAQADGVGEALYGVFYDQQIEYRYMSAFAEPEKWSDQEVMEAMASNMRDFPGSRAAALAVVRELRRLPSLEPRYGEVLQPALLVWCREDQVSLLRYGERLSNELPAARLEVIPQCGHIAPIEQQAAFVGLLKGFLP